MAGHNTDHDSTPTHPPTKDYFDQDMMRDAEQFHLSEAQRLRGRLTTAMLDAEVGSVLDVGCGSGFITRQLRVRGPVVGLDRSTTSLAKFEGNGLLGSIDMLPFADRAFEAVVCCEVLEHLSPEVFRRGVAELSRVADRFLLLSVPYREFLDNDTTQCCDCGHRYNIHGHRRVFDGPETLVRRFPGFSLDAHALIGRKHETKSALFRWARRTLLGAPASLPGATCPKCGCDRNASYRELRRKGLRRRLIEGLQWRLPKVTRPVWMIVRLRRAE